MNTTLSKGLAYFGKKLDRLGTKGIPSPWEHVTKYAEDAVIAATLFVLLVIATVFLRFCAHWLADCPFHHVVVVIIEGLLFVLAALLLLLLAITKWITTVLEILKDFFDEIKR